MEPTLAQRQDPQKPGKTLLVINADMLVTMDGARREIRGVVLNARDITDRVQLEEQLTRQAFHDGLTGLPNRALFRDRLDHALSRSSRTGDVLAVLEGLQPG